MQIRQEKCIKKQVAEVGDFILLKSGIDILLQITHQSLGPCFVVNLDSGEVWGKSFIDAIDCLRYYENNAKYTSAELIKSSDVTIILN